MAIQFFEEAYSHGIDLDFAKDYLSNFPKENGASYNVSEIVLAASGKGYMIKTDRFICWLWKKQSTAKMLIEALEKYVEEGYGYMVVAVLDKDAKDGYKLGIDPEQPCNWFGKGKKFTVIEDTFSSQETTQNPFFIPRALYPPTTVPATQTGRKAQKSHLTPGDASN